MSLRFDIFSIHGVLMLFNAYVKISSGFVGQLFFLLHAHLPLKIKSNHFQSLPPMSWAL